MNTQFLGHNLKQTIKEKAASDNLVHAPMGTGESALADCDPLYSAQASTIERKMSRKSNGEMWRRDNGIIYDSSIESSGYNATNSPLSCAATKDGFRRQKVDIFNFDIQLICFLKLITWSLITCYTFDAVKK